MKPSTEEFLYVLLWTADTFMRPTWRNLNDGFEAWAWRNRLGRRIAELEQQQLIERAPEFLAHAVVRLTNHGRLAALGGRDPDAQWHRPWDGQWRMIVFDIPVREHALHLRLWRNLRRQGFGFLQNSLWITPDPIDRERLAQSSSVPSVEMIIVMQGRPCGGETDPAVVRGAWDFDVINGAYRHCQAWLKRAPGPGADFAAIRDWAQAERTAWMRAIRQDPFLPAALLPRGYLGRCTWEQHRQTLARLAPHLQRAAAALTETLR